MFKVVYPGKREMSKRQDKIALVTSNFGGIDDIKPIPHPHSQIETLYYTDEATINCTPDESKVGWDQICTPNYPRYDFNPRLRGRYFKHQIHRLDEVQDCRWLVWADANIRYEGL